MRDEMVALLPELGRFASYFAKRWDRSEDLLHDTIVRRLPLNTRLWMGRTSARGYSRSCGTLG